MRVPDYVLQSVGFIGEFVGADADSDSYDLVGTGFIVTIPSEAMAGHRYPMFVTAKHVAERLKGRSITCIVNKRGGGVVSLDVIGNQWFTHPTDNTVDVAVVPFNIAQELDTVSIPTHLFLSPDKMNDLKIGVGDQVIFPGLFSYAPGATRNMPILRSGNIAMLPDGPIQVESKFCEVYLIEARSIGGMSGSPVFVRQTVGLKTVDGETNEEELLLTTSSKFRLLGLIHGHWDVRESEINAPSFVHDRQRGVNMGIGVVVPASKILEVLDHPEVRGMVQRAEERIKTAVSPGPDDGGVK